jgi:hypothetical protein
LSCRSFDIQYPTPIVANKEESKAIRFVISLVFVIVLSGAMMIVQDRRDRWLQQISNDAPQLERERSSKIALRLGGTLISAVRVASSLIAVSAFGVIWIGALTGYLGWLDLLTLVSGFIVAGVIYLWADRITESLPK